MATCQNVLLNIYKKKPDNRKENSILFLSNLFCVLVTKPTTTLHCEEVDYSTYKNMQSNMLQSAKANLLKLFFFGLTIYQIETQLLFEETFGVYFNKEFKQHISISDEKWYNYRQLQTSISSSKDPLTDAECAIHRLRLWSISYLDVKH